MPAVLFIRCFLFIDLSDLLMYRAMGGQYVNSVELLSKNLIVQVYNYYDEYSVFAE